MKTSETIEFGSPPANLPQIMALADLSRQFVPLPVADCPDPFPAHVFPAALENFINEAARSIGCPSDYVGVPMLALAGAAIGTSRAIQIKKGWTEAPRIFAAIVGDPGDRKSPALAVVTYPFHKRQKALAAEYETRKKAYEEEKLVYDIRAQVWRDDSKQALKSGHHTEDQPTPPQQPLMSRVLADDSTTEAMAVLLKNNPRGIILIRDEISGWVAGLDQYRGGKGSDRQFYLSAWNGSSVTVDRKGRQEPINISNPFLSVVGGLAKDIITAFVDSHGREDGFIHRILFTLPEASLSKWTEETISDTSLAAWDQAVERLWGLPGSIDESGSGLPSILSLSPEARSEWEKAINAHREEQSEPLFEDHLRGPWAKFEGYAARLALILYELRFLNNDAPEEQIDAKSIKNAFILIDYFKQHSKRVYKHLRTTNEDKRISRAVRWISKQPGKCCIGRDFLRNNVSGVKTMHEAINLFRELQERGYGNFIETDGEDAKSKYVFTLTDPTNRHHVETGEE